MQAKRSEEQWLADVESADERRVISALHEACPCTGSATRYENYTTVLRRFKKDPRPAVRKVALHLERDALDELVMEDERANGFVRNRPGGGGRAETRRPDRRQGF